METKLRLFEDQSQWREKTSFTFWKIFFSAGNLLGRANLILSYLSLKEVSLPLDLTWLTKARVKNNILEIMFMNEFVLETKTTLMLQLNVQTKIVGVF